MAQHCSSSINGEWSSGSAVAGAFFGPFVLLCRSERAPPVPHMQDQELSWTSLDQRAVDTVRVLAADAVEKVGNGHPGTAMSLAPAAYLIFQQFMRHDPTDPQWVGRDRFVLSPGHTSLTLYIQLFLSG